jgi:2-octaprenyl-6-methoxyphenol hydroxylase
MSQSIKSDVVIVGGGPVGASAALALAAIGLRPTVVEPVPAHALHQPSYDGRSLVLNHASVRILEQLGIWSRLQGMRQAVEHIHVSQLGHLGTARLHAQDEGVEALGYVVEAAALGQALRQGLEDNEQIQLLCPAKLQDFCLADDQVCARVVSEGGEHRVQAPLMLGVDGQHSLVRQQLGIAVERFDYGQAAIVSTVMPSLAHNNWAWERFTPTGPLAMLPRVGGKLGVVWCAQAEQVEQLTALDDEAWLQALQQRFGYRLGRLRQPGKRASYPLVRQRARHDVAERCILLGNAAHAVHPVAGQGFNLGLRDVAWLADVLAQQRGGDLGAANVVQAYQQGRREDHDQTIRFTDSLVRLFSNDWPGLGHMRGAGLMGVDLLAGVKQRLARGAMGYRGKRPSMLREDDAA